MAGLLVNLQNEWAVQTLVLFSFALQVFLLLFAWIRRHNVSTVPKMLLWLAYQLADSTALFTLGHLSISSKLHEHQLVAFWAPFLLVHLGGQDTITAYSFEDSRLWPRHLQTLVVQVLGAAYVLYKYMPDSETFVMVAAVLIFIVGVLKYGERIWALKCSSMDSIWSSLDKSDASVRDIENKLLHEKVLEEAQYIDIDAEDVLMGAHGLLDVCKELFIGFPRRRHEGLHKVMRSFETHDCLDKLMEMELSLMYDILYTKAEVIHTWYGGCIRVVSLVATAAAFLLFQYSSKDGHKRNDVAITYVLSVGALLLEMASLVKAVGSTWTIALSYKKKWSGLQHDILSLRRLVTASRHRKWSGSVGQYNLLQSCACDALEPAGIKTARLLGLGHIAEHWWGKLRHARSAKLSDSTKELVLRGILEMEGRSDKIGSLPGLLTLQRFQLEEYIGWSIHDIGFEDSIMAWHVASEICLFNDRSEENLLEANLQKAKANLLKAETKTNLLEVEAKLFSANLPKAKTYLLKAKEKANLLKADAEANLLEVNFMEANLLDAEAKSNLPPLLKAQAKTNLLEAKAKAKTKLLEGNLLVAKAKAKLLEATLLEAKEKKNLREAIRVLSNYMMFLLVLRPYMLPGPVRRSRYIQVRDDLYRVMRSAVAVGANTPEKRVNWALSTGLHALFNSFDAQAHYDTGVILADMLYHQSNKLDVIFGVWVEMLCYVANHCSRESHARQLSSGGELVTIVWLMARHANLL